MYSRKLSTSIPLRLLFLTAVLTTVSAPTRARAATLTVTSLANDGTGTLRAAIGSATPGDTIVFKNGLTGTIKLYREINITKDLTIVGPGARSLTISGERRCRSLSVTSLSKVNISGLTIANGYSRDGGAIDNTGYVTLRDCALSNNTAMPQGGAIYNANTEFTAINCTFSGNKALSNETNGQPGLGGAIHNEDGKVTLVDCTFSGNNARFGGAVYNGEGYPYDVTGEVSFTNCTLSGNGSTPDITTEAGGGIYNNYHLTISNSIIAGNTASAGPDVYNNASGPVPSNTTRVGKGSLTSQGYNIIGDTSGAGFTPTTGDQLNVNPKLATLYYNGGPTQTYKLLPGSPAIDAGGNDLAREPSGAPLQFDQRGTGFPRYVGGIVDIGAFEAPPEDGGGGTSPPVGFTVSTTFTPSSGSPTSDSPTSATLVYTLTNNSTAAFTKIRVIGKDLGKWFGDNYTLTRTKGNAVVQVTNPNTMARRILWNGFNLDPGASARMTFTVQIPPGSGGRRIVGHTTITFNTIGNGTIPDPLPQVYVPTGE